MKDLQNIFNEFPFELDIFQKKGIEAFENNENILITAHTGSGKSVLAEHAIKKCKKIGKKSIYTSPIKSLSNQKFYEFTKKFPNIEFGILTGDIKFKPYADCIIMTTEILRNLLYKKNSNNEILDKTLSLDIDIDNEVGVIIFDEVHYINNKDRGKVWEESIILSPKHIQLVMLSATIKNSCEFANWIENIKEKKVRICSNNKRVIPLNHYLYHYLPFNKIKKDFENMIKRKKTNNNIIKNNYINKIDKYANKFVKLLDEDNKFFNDSISEIIELKKLEKKIKTYLPDKKVIMSLCELLHKNNQTPCLFFVFSRKRCKKYANYIEQSFISAKESAEVSKIINTYINKLNDKTIYENLEQFYFLKKILEKGIAIHHSGLIPIFKEIIEILFSKNLIKVLFATETFAVGVNMPTKTVIFTDIKKYCENQVRFLKTSEYLQMSGRAGRRGLDKFGNVIILSNTADIDNIHTIKNIMTGDTQEIKSKFIFKYQFILKIILAEHTSANIFLNNTLLNKDIIKKLNNIEHLIENNKVNIQISDEDQKKFSEYKKLYDIKNNNDGFFKLSKKQIKKMKKYENNKCFLNEYKFYHENLNKINEYDNLLSTKNYYENLIHNDINNSINYLVQLNYINNINNLNLNSITSDSLTIKGIIASQINECNEILFTELLTNNIFDNLDTNEIISILSIFCQSNNLSNINDLNITKSIKETYNKITNISLELENLEINYKISIDNDWNVYNSLLEYTYLWAKGTKFCELLYDDFEGNFIKHIIKIDNIAKDLLIMAEFLGKYELVQKVSHISNKIIRDIVNTESLYIK